MAKRRGRCLGANGGGELELDPNLDACVKEKRGGGFVS